MLPNFTNHTYDEVLGVYYAQARFYDPTEQRFLAPDSHWDAFNRVYGDAGNALVDNAPSIAAIRQSANLYTYAINNPLLYTDPLGQFTSIEDYEYQVQQRSFGHRIPDPNGYAAVGAGRGGYYTAFGCAPKPMGFLDKVGNTIGSWLNAAGDWVGNGIDKTGELIDSINQTLEPVRDYIDKSVDQLLFGNYTENVTILGTAGQVGTGVLGVDIVGDVRDIIYDFSNWKPTPEHRAQTAIDVVAVLPLIGAIKYGDEAAAIVKGTKKGIKFGSDTKSATKLTNQMAKRGWTESTVRSTVNSPYTTRVSTNMATGNPASVYYNQAGAYVIIDDVTNAVVQVSDNINPSTWIPDPNIINPYKP